MNWRKSKRSFANGNCVEVADKGGAVLVRDSKDGGQGAVLRFTAGGWRKFTRELRR